MTFPTVPTLDDFNRADAGTLGPNWSEFTQGVTILNNYAYVTSAPFPGGAVWNQATWQEVAAFMEIREEHGYAALFARSNLASNYNTLDGYFVRYSSTVISLHRADAGKINDIATPTQVLVNFPLLLGITCEGSTITAHYKESGGEWTAFLTATDSTYPDAGYVGFYGTVALEINEVGAGPTTLPVIRSLALRPRSTNLTLPDRSLALNLRARSTNLTLKERPQ